MIIMSNRVQTMRLGGLQKQLETLQQEKEKEREETSAVTLGIGIEWHLIGEEGRGEWRSLFGWTRWTSVISVEAVPFRISRCG